MYWVDIEGSAVFCYDPVSGEAGTVLEGTTVTALSEIRDGGLFMVTPGALLTFHGGDPVTVASYPLRAGTRSNDGKCDPSGRVWFGTMDIEATRPIGELFVFDGETVRVVQDGIVLANGLGWSPNRDVFYHVDSVRRVLHAYSYREDTGEVSDRRVLIDMTGRSEVPDGLAVDVDGNIWVAMWDGWRIDVYAPSGERVHVEELDVQRPTSLAFGGADMSNLYVTSASVDLSAGELEDQPDAGRLLRTRPGVAGLAVGATDLVP